MPSAAKAIPRAVRAAVASCAATAASAEKTSPEQASARPKASEPRRGTSVVSSPAVADQPGRHRGAERQQQRGGQAGIAADGGRIDQLGTARLLLGAGVPDDGQDHRHPISV